MSGSSTDRRRGGRVSDAEAWLELRLAEVPAELAGAIRRAMSGGASPEPETEVGRALAEAALAELSAVVESDQSRPTALRLLAADALLTYAFEAAADLDEDRLELARDLGPRGRLGRRMRASGAAREPGLSSPEE